LMTVRILRPRYILIRSQAGSASFRYYEELFIDVETEQEPRSGVVMLGTILLIILILILIGALPTWPYSGGWGYYPSGGFGLLVVIVIILLLMGRI
jgi:hypothetical protein